MDPYDSPLRSSIGSYAVSSKVGLLGHRVLGFRI